jgi:hypothetical protein
MRCRCEELQKEFSKEQELDCGPWVPWALGPKSEEHFQSASLCFVLLSVIEYSGRRSLKQVLASVFNFFHR